MEYRSLGRTGVKVSKLCLGTMMLGRRADERESLEMIAHALDAGVNFIDTANAYANGTSERYVGKALAQGKRVRVVLATKCYFPEDPDDPNARGLSRRNVIATCEAALKRLGTPYSEEEIAAGPSELEGKTEQDALVAYLQGLGTQIKTRN